jgi:hypothetical protein
MSPLFFVFNKNFPQRIILASKQLGIYLAQNWQKEQRITRNEVLAFQAVINNE